jgi:hypothetical protein
MAVTHVFAGVAVADYESAPTWYQRLTGRPPDVIPVQTIPGIARTAAITGPEGNTITFGETAAPRGVDHAPGTGG